MMEVDDCRICFKGVDHCVEHVTPPSSFTLKFVFVGCGDALVFQEWSSHTSGGQTWKRREWIYVTSFSRAGSSFQLKPLVFPKSSSHTLGLEIFGHLNRSPCQQVFRGINTDPHKVWLKTRDDFGFVFLYFRYFFADLIPWYITMFPPPFGEYILLKANMRDFVSLFFSAWDSSPVSCWKT